jgi:hypothetical protein
MMARKWDLKILNGLLGSIATMYVRRDELVPDLPFVHNGRLEFGADFIVEDLERLWKAMVMYWLLLQARMGSLLVLLV